jgi:TfoX/Sxy family transcriptional regulator of competence genes
MSSDENFMSYVVEQMRGAGPISFRKMFGEYAIYCGETVVAFVCDNQLFVKPTPGGRALLGSPRMAPPYPGAKLHFLLDDGLDDGESLSQLIAVTARELPVPKAKKAEKAKKAKKLSKANKANKANSTKNAAKAKPAAKRKSPRRQEIK